MVLATASLLNRTSLVFEIQSIKPSFFLEKMIIEVTVVGKQKVVHHGIEFAIFAFLV